MEQLESKFTDALLSTITLNSLRWKKDMIDRWQTSFSRLAPGTHYISSVTGVPFGIYVVGLTPEYQFFHSAGFFISDFSGLCEKTTNRYNDGVDNDCDGFIDEERENAKDFICPKSRYGPVCEYTCTCHKDGKDCAISEQCGPVCDPKVSSTCKHGQIEMLIHSRSWGKQFVLPQTVKESCEQSVPFLTHQPITVIHTTATEQTQTCEETMVRYNDGVDNYCDGFIYEERKNMKDDDRDGTEVEDMESNTRGWHYAFPLIALSQNKILKVLLFLMYFTTITTAYTTEEHTSVSFNIPGKLCDSVVLTTSQMCSNFTHILEKDLATCNLEKAELNTRLLSKLEASDSRLLSELEASDSYIKVPISSIPIGFGIILLALTILGVWIASLHSARDSLATEKKYMTREIEEYKKLLGLRKKHVGQSSGT